MTGTAQVFTAPARIATIRPLLFLGGGITGCPDWQSDAIQRLEGLTRWGLLNPRRDDFDTSNTSNSFEQIEWEFDGLRRAALHLFWFPAESDCPITLYELGFSLGAAYALGKTPRVRIGVDPGYPRRLDVQVQARLANYSHPIANNLRDLTAVTLEAALVLERTL